MTMCWVTWSPVLMRSCQCICQGVYSGVSVDMSVIPEGIEIFPYLTGYYCRFPIFASVPLQEVELCVGWGPWRIPQVVWSWQRCYHCRTAPTRWPLSTSAVLEVRLQEVGVVRENLFSSGRSLLLYKFIRNMMKLMVGITEAYHFY